MADSRKELLTTLLRDVSRSFYKTLSWLPAPVRPQIGLAYLLARTSDTIADTSLLPAEQRLAALREFLDRVVGRSGKPLQLGSFAQGQGSAAERRLLENAEAILALLDSLAGPDRELVRQVIRIIVGGQELDLTRFAGAGAGRVIALNSDGELDDYTYRVAGCVGEFWTRMCRAHLFPAAALDEPALLADGVRFGKGLQLVNVLRDLPSDLRQGRCYLPAPDLAEVSLAPVELLEPANEPRLRPLYDRHLARCQDHLLAGWRYTNALPRRQVRVRLACAWPILIGLETVRLLRAVNILDPAAQRKISRSQVRRILVRTICAVPFESAWRSLASGRGL